MSDEQPAAAPRPRRYKQALLTWLAVYPTLTLFLAILNPLMEGWPLPLRTLLVVSLMIPTLFWVILPLLNRLFRGWLIR
jgi:antibiotic biosynthesis monooxygenase (ABM) superfamily enzyme